MKGPHDIADAQTFPPKVVKFPMVRLKTKSKRIGSNFFRVSHFVHP